MKLENLVTPSDVHAEKVATVKAVACIIEPKEICVCVKKKMWTSDRCGIRLTFTFFHWLRQHRACVICSVFAARSSICQRASMPVSKGHASVHLIQCHCGTTTRPVCLKSSRLSSLVKIYGLNRAVNLMLWYCFRKYYYIKLTKPNVCLWTPHKLEIYTNCIK